MQTLLRSMVVAAVLLLGHMAAAQQPTKQIELTAAQIEAYLAAQPEIFVIQKKILIGEISPKDPKMIADITALAKKHGLGLTEYNDVVVNLILVFNRIDPNTKALKDEPVEPPIKYPGNVDLVIKYYDRISSAFLGG